MDCTLKVNSAILAYTDNMYSVCGVVRKHRESIVCALSVIDKTYYSSTQIADKVGKDVYPA